MTKSLEACQDKNREFIDLHMLKVILVAIEQFFNGRMKRG